MIVSLWKHKPFFCLQGSIVIKPDQMQVFNPLLILCLIPVFETVVYPLMKRVGLPTGWVCNIRTRFWWRFWSMGMVEIICLNLNTFIIPISFRATFRMVFGLILVSFSFIICGFVELGMEERVAAYNEAHGTAETLDTLPSKYQLHILTTIPQIFAITCGEILCSITGLEFAYAYVSLVNKSSKTHSMI